MDTTTDDEYLKSQAFAQPANPRPTRAMRASIPPDVLTQLATLRTRDNWRNWYYLGGDWSIIGLATTVALASGMQPLAYIAAVIVIGSRQRGLMNLLHEASHRKLFKSRILNDWAARLLTAYPLMSTTIAYSSEHARHHRWLWCAGRDPKLERYQQLGLVEPPTDRARFLQQHVLQPMLLRHVPHNVLSALTSSQCSNGRERFDRVGRMVFMVALFATVAALGYTRELILFWVVPYVTSFQVIRYWAEMAEHAGLETDNPWEATRSWTSGATSRWLIGSHHDDLYHLVHHLFPAIPHYRLPDAHRLLLRVPQYAGAHHCDGFFFRRSTTRPSVLDDIMGDGKVGFGSVRTKPSTHEPASAEVAGAASESDVFMSTALRSEP